ncbi:MAG: UTP--glucose-1-phosphate uridylyltransferase [Deltaproteobacteria bacterium]|jgi:UTP--glucose-1-phosphate uridylyltransferase|nr:UTP--glucose-1-phosphate uridylyltransferase [Deltaproteobacteria bacterium]
MKNSEFTAVIPAAGLGTRLLPATKAIPKELLPIVDVPAIQLIIEEIRDSGIENTVFVTASGKEAIVDHFDVNQALEAKLEERGNLEMLESVQKPVELNKFAAVRQHRPLGLGHAVLTADNLVPGPVAVVLPDDIIDSETPVLKQLLDVYRKHDADVVLALMEVPLEDTSKYGIAGGSELENGVYAIDKMVEKPNPEAAPSRNAIIGRYLMDNSIFTYLSRTKKGKGGEVQLTDALQAMVESGKKVLGCRFEGKRFDTGNVKGYLSASINYAMKRECLRNHLHEIMKEYLE